MAMANLDDDALLWLAVFSGAPAAGASAGVPVALTHATRLRVVETTWPALREVPDGTPMRLCPRGGVLTVGSVAVAAAPPSCNWLTLGGHGGLDFSPVVAVDLAAANGLPGAPGWLHRLPPGGGGRGRRPREAGECVRGGPRLGAHHPRALRGSPGVAACGFGAASAACHPVSPFFSLAGGGAVSPLVTALQQK